MASQTLTFFLVSVVGLFGAVLDVLMEQPFFRFLLVTLAFLCAVAALAWLVRLMEHRRF